MADETATADTKQPSLDTYKRMFDEARDNMQDTRKLQECCRDYYDGKQLTAAQRRVLRLRKQPDVVINRTRRAVEGILGIVEQGKTDPVAHMRAPAEVTPQPQQRGIGDNGGPPMEQPEPDLDAGDVATMTLQYVANANRFQARKMDAFENMMIEGTGAKVIEWDDDAKEIVLNDIAVDEYFWDPYSRKADFSDKRYDGIAKWMHADDVTALYPDKATEIETAIAAGDAGRAADQLWADKPEKGVKPWIDRKKRRLMVVEMYHREGPDWYRCVFHGGGKLEFGPSAYKDDTGRTTNPIEAQSIYISRELLRYGVVKDMIDVQDEINARRSKAIHEIATRQIQQVDPNSPPIDVEDARKEAAKPDGVLPPGWQIVPRNDVVANSIEMLQEAKAEIERLAPNPATVGRAAVDASGRAQQFRAQAGMTELARPLGRFTDWESRVYKQIWNRARQFYTDPKWIYVTGDDGSPQYVRINEPGPVQIDPVTMQPIPGPVKNHIAKMDVDIIMDSVPDTATLEQEIFNEFMQLAQTYGPQFVPFKVVMQLSPIPKHRKIVKMLEQAQAEAAQANAPAAQIQAAQAQANIGKTQSETEKNLATAKATEIGAVRDAMQGHAEALNPHAMLPPPPGATGAPGSPPAV